MEKVDFDSYKISRIDKKDITRFNGTLGLSVVILICLANVNFHNTIMSITLFMGSLFLLLWGLTLRKKFGEIELRGNLLIVSYAKNSTVTTLKSLKKIYSKRLLNRKLTFVIFYLDGKEYSVVLITPIHHSPGKILTELKNKKADL